MDKSTLKVHLPDGSFNVVRFGDATDIKGIIHLLTSKKTNDSRTYQHLYGMRMINTVSQEVAWLHKDTTMLHVQKSMKQSQETSTGPQTAPIQPEGGEVSGGDWRFELRIRYLPNDWSEVYEKDNITFMCYYNQVLSDYLNKNFDSIDHDTAIQLGCLEIRRLFKDMLQNALDKKSNIEYLEKEVGLHKFLPKVVLETVKSKSIRKLIQQHFKKFSNFTERDCMFKFMDLLKTVYRYDQERFRFVSFKMFF
jgi:focal adhesion kinase 1